MKIDTETMKETLRRFILDEFLPGEDPNSLTDETPLITGGVLDSIATIKFASFIEERYEVELPDEALNADNMDTIEKVVSLVRTKLPD